MHRMNSPQHRTITRRIKVIVVYLLVVVVYLIIGGACMSAFEGNAERDNGAEQEAYVRDHLNLTQDVMDDLERVGICSFPKSHTKHWTITGATFYSLTVITTIGYGSFAPKTLGGRTFTVFYAMFGISVIGLLLSNLAVVIAGLFQSLAGRIWVPQRFVALERQQTADRVLAANGRITGDEFQCLLMAIMEIPDAEWDELHEGKILADICARYQDGEGCFDKEAIIRGVVRWQHIEYSRPAPANKRILLLMFVVCAVWVVAWAAVFRGIEGWGFWDSVWYACVTLSTIGFGDFVPETIPGRLAAFVFIAPGIGMVAAFISGLTNWFELIRFWLLQKLHEKGTISEKIMVAQGVNVSLKPNQGLLQARDHGGPFGELTDGSVNETMMLPVRGGVGGSDPGSGGAAKSDLATVDPLVVRREDSFDAQHPVRRVSSTNTGSNGVRSSNGSAVAQLLAVGGTPTSATAPGSQVQTPTARQAGAYPGHSVSSAPQGLVGQGNLRSVLKRSAHPLPKQKRSKSVPSGLTVDQEEQGGASEALDYTRLASYTPLKVATPPSDIEVRKGEGRSGVMPPSRLLAGGQAAAGEGAPKQRRSQFTPPVLSSPSSQLAPRIGRSVSPSFAEPSLGAETAPSRSTPPPSRVGGDVHTAGGGGGGGLRSVPSWRGEGRGQLLGSDAAAPVGGAMMLSLKPSKAFGSGKEPPLKLHVGSAQSARPIGSIAAPMPPSRIGLPTPVSVPRPRW